MKVIDSEPRFWYLLLDGAELILNVSCEYSFVSYDFTMKLSDDEVGRYQENGRTFISQLAEAINYSCPIARGSASVFKDRNVDAQYSDAILRALELWRQSEDAR